MKYLISALVFAIALFAAPAGAAELTSGQLSTLKAAAVADPTANGYLQNGQDTQLAEWFNAASTCTVWRSALPEDEITDTVGSGGTTWSWTTYIGRSVAEKAAWERMVARGYINPSLSQVRAGWADIFSGTASTAVEMRDHITALSKRLGSRAEHVLASGACSVANPATMGWEGIIYDASAIRNAP